MEKNKFSPFFIKLLPLPYYVLTLHPKCTENEFEQKTIHISPHSFCDYLNPWNLLGFKIGPSHFAKFKVFPHEHEQV
jgi:hypothetical protein